MRTMMTAAVLVLAVGMGTAAEPLKSGLEVGEYVKPFEPLNVTGEYAGQEKCLVCTFGADPVACVFVRELSPPFISLLKKIDEATARNSKADMGSFVCVCTDDSQKTEKELKELAKKHGIKTTILALCPAEGPGGYKIASQADITVLLYVEGQVKANFAFEKGKMTEKDVEQILAALPKILPKK